MLPPAPWGWWRSGMHMLQEWPLLCCPLHMGWTSCMGCFCANSEHGAECTVLLLLCLLLLLLLHTFQPLAWFEAPSRDSSVCIEAVVKGSQLHAAVTCYSANPATVDAVSLLFSQLRPCHEA